LCFRVPPQNPSHSQAPRQSAPTPSLNQPRKKASDIHNDSDDEDEAADSDGFEDDSDALERQNNKYDTRDPGQESGKSQYDSVYSAGQSYQPGQSYHTAQSYQTGQNYQTEQTAHPQSTETITNMMSNMWPWASTAQASTPQVSATQASAYNQAQPYTVAGPGQPSIPTPARSSTIASLPKDIQKNIGHNERRFIKASPDNSAYEKLDSRKDVFLAHGVVLISLGFRRVTTQHHRFFFVTGRVSLNLHHK
jgi:hypothetical protein